MDNLDIIGIILLLVGLISLSVGAALTFLNPLFFYVVVFGYILCIIAPVLILFDLLRQEDMVMEYDNVNHPAHYNTGKYESIDVMVETQGVDAVKNFCICNAFKYIYRHRFKNGVEDIKKAIWYLNKYVELEESNETN